MRHRQMRRQAFASSSLAPLKLVSPLLNPSFLSPTVAYSFIETRVAALNLTTPVQPLLRRGCLQEAVPGIASLGALDLEDCLVSGRRNTLKDLVPEVPPQSQTQMTYIMQAAPRSPPLQSPNKKLVTLSNPWRLRLFPSAAKHCLCTMLHTKQLPQGSLLQLSGKTTPHGGSEKHIAPGCASPPTSKESRIQSLSFKYSLNASDQEYKRPTYCPFQNEAWSNTSAPWGIFSWQWVPRIPDTTPWTASTFGWADNLRPMHTKILPPLESAPSQSPSSTVSARQPKEAHHDNRPSQTWPGSLSSSYCVQANISKEATTQSPLPFASNTSSSTWTERPSQPLPQLLTTVQPQVSSASSSPHRRTAPRLIQSGTERLGIPGHVQWRQSGDMQMDTPGSILGSNQHRLYIVSCCVE